MKQNNRFCVLALTAVLALTLTACSETADGSAASGSTQTTQPAQSTAQQDTSAGTPSASQQTEVLGSLTSSELQELVSGSTTLEQLTQQRAEAADPGTGSTTALPEYEQQLQALINQLYAVKAGREQPEQHHPVGHGRVQGSACRQADQEPQNRHRDGQGQ